MRRMSLPLVLTAIASAALGACSDDPPIGTLPAPAVVGLTPVTAVTANAGPRPGDLVFGGQVVDNPARVMVTGTLAVTRGGSYAVAADNERDELVSVALDTRRVRRVALTEGDEPGRTIAGRADRDGTHTYTALRGASAVADLHVEASEVERVPTCQAPRGLAYDEATSLLHVACATGELVSYDVGTWRSVRHIAVARDLRDVVVTERGLLVSRFASAELVLVDEAGQATSLGEPNVPPACTEPTVMHRIAARDGKLYAAHQLATTDLVLGRGAVSTCDVAQSTTVHWRVPLDEVLGLADAVPPTPDANAGLDAPSYWRSLSWASNRVPMMDAVVEGPRDARYLAELGNSVGPMDLAVSATGRTAISVAGNFWQPNRPTILTWDDVEGAQQVTLAAARPGGMVTSVAFDGDDSWIAQSREPAGLYFEDGDVVFFGGRSVGNSSFAIFHMDSGVGISCASCHPEGGEDDHVWRLPNGLRRTLPLGPSMHPEGPYNWDRSDGDMPTLLSDVLNLQMSHDYFVNWSQSRALQAWINGLRLPSPGVVTNIGAAQRGADVFRGAGGCVNCHAPPLYTDGVPYDVQTGGAFETPSLLGVGARSKLLHDGCAATLREVFGACGGDANHRVLERLSSQQVNDLIAFVSTL